jgi:hypothetical protein
MTDSHLNSIHLPAPRREEFRAARQAVLQACGSQTLMGARPEPATGSGTNVWEQEDGSACAAFVLVDRDHVYPLKVGLNTVGRMPDNDVVIHDPYVSRRHCVIVVHAGDGCELHDVASKNGTLVNGQKIQGAARLAPGDQICMCERRLTFQATGAGAEPSNPHTMVLD